MKDLNISGLKFIGVIQFVIVCFLTACDVPKTFNDPLDYFNKNDMFMGSDLLEVQTKNDSCICEVEEMRTSCSVFDIKKFLGDTCIFQTFMTFHKNKIVSRHSKFKFASKKQQMAYWNIIVSGLPTDFIYVNDPLFPKADSGYYLLISQQITYSISKLDKEIIVSTSYNEYQKELLLK